jgi:uncharacterized protein YdeI (YjbR/CyaY-like superfamily)
LAPELPIRSFRSPAAWATWLGKHYAASDGLWVRIAKQSTGIASVRYPEVLDVAISYGWIDGHRKADDEQYFLQRFTPRRARSKWSEKNCAKAVAMIERGEMHPAGLREVERAKADGRWDEAYAPQSTATVPDDLQEALDRNPRAKAFYATLDSRNRYAVLFRIHEAKRSETRARRIEKFVAMLADHEKLHP